MVNMHQTPLAYGTTSQVPNLSGLLLLCHCILSLYLEGLSHLLCPDSSYKPSFKTEGSGSLALAKVNYPPIPPCGSWGVSPTRCVAVMSAWRAGACLAFWDVPGTYTEPGSSQDIL